MWLCDHPEFKGVDYRSDIGKLKGMHVTWLYRYSLILVSADAKISGDVFLKLDEDSLEHYGLSAEFQTPLMKIVKKVVILIQYQLKDNI